MHLKKIPILFLFVNFLFTFHFALTSYIHAQYLKLFVPTEVIGFLFCIAALFSLIILSYLERFLVRYKERVVTLSLLGIDMVALGVLSWHGVIPSFFSIFAILAFIIHISIALFILRAVFDIYFEEKSSDKETGIFRGELLASANIAWLLSQLLVSQQLYGGDFWKVYAVSLITTFLLFALLYVQMPHRGVMVKPIFFIETLSNVWRKKKIFFITLGNFLLHFFFSWMIIYLGIYLHETIGFSQGDVALILAVMLLPYVLIDIPLGSLVDTYGERTFLFIGFLVMALFTLPLGLATTNGFLFWAAMLFVTRIGAAIVELTTDTYFFRNVEASDGNMIGFYRYAQPMAYIVGSLSASLILLLGATEKNLFLILSGIMFLGILIPLVLPGTWFSKK